MKITNVEFDADPRKCAVILEDGSKLERIKDMACAISVGGMLEVTVTVLVPNVKPYNQDEGVRSIDVTDLSSEKV